MRILALFVALPLAACSYQSDASPPAAPASGSGTTRSFAVADFTGVALRGSDDVDVRVGSTFSVRAQGPSAELDQLEIIRVGDTLRIGRKHDTGISWGGASQRGVAVFVTMPRIVAATIAGSGAMTIDRIMGQTFDGESAGSGKLSIALLRVAQAKLAVAGPGDIVAKGNVGQATLNVAGAGSIVAPGLAARGASVSIAGSGNVRAAISGTARVSIVGSGDVDLGGGAHCTTTKIGSGTVQCGG